MLNTRRYIYPTLEIMLDEYNSADVRDFIVVEKRVYNYVAECRRGNVKLHMYRNIEEEQYYILIFMRYDIAFFIKPLYSIQRLTRADMWEFMNVNPLPQGGYAYGR